MSPLRFDAATHSFWRDGVRIPSVTQVLRRCNLTSPFWTEEARARGERVHVALAKHARGEDGDDGLRSDDLPFYRAGLRALDQFGIEVLAAEEVVDGGSYAGFLDLRCRLRGHDDPFVIDLKTGRAPAYTPLQLAAYAAPQPVPHRRAFIELLPSGAPKMTVCRETRGDLRNFHACLAVALLQISLEVPDVE